MAADKLSDAEAKQILLKWPTRTNIWPAPGGTGYWLQAQPKSGNIPGPRISSPGATQFRTQPDALWAFFHPFSSCDLVAVEVCGTIQNLNDKRSRYIPSSHSLVLSVSASWLNQTIPIQGGGQRTRWESTGTLTVAPVADLVLPVRHLRVLYALPNTLYHVWCSEHTSTGYEFFSPHSSLSSYNSQPFQEFLKRMSIATQFYVTPGNG